MYVLQDNIKDEIMLAAMRNLKCVLSRDVIYFIICDTEQFL